MSRLFLFLALSLAACAPRASLRPDSGRPTPPPAPPPRVVLSVEKAWPVGPTFADTLGETPPPHVPAIPLCETDARAPMTFEHLPTYSDRIEKDGEFHARYWVGNAAACSRRVFLAVSFTPPHTTATRTVTMLAFVPPRGSLVDVDIGTVALAAANVVPGRYAVSFGVLDEESQPVGRMLSGNPFQFGQDDVRFVSAPTLPPRIGRSDDLVIPLELENVGDTPNRVTPLVVFTRPGETAGIEHYEPPALVVPGISRLVVTIPRPARDTEGVGAGTWLVTVTMFDATGSRLASYAGLPLTIGQVDLRMTRPELPVRVAQGEDLRVRFRLENRGDVADRVSAVVAFTKPGAPGSIEFAFSREVAPGSTSFDAVIEPGRRRERGVDRGVWLVTTAAFQGSGARVKSFSGHYLEITD